METIERRRAMTARVNIRTRYVTRPASNVGAILATGGGRTHRRTVNQADSMWVNHRDAARTLAERLGYVDVMTEFGDNGTGTFWRALSREDVRRDALRMFSDHGHGGYWDKLTRENCGACALGGYGAYRNGHGHLTPNYAGWARDYVRAGILIPAKFADAFDDELHRDDNESYRRELARDVALFGAMTENMRGGQS